MIAKRLIATSAARQQVDRDQLVLRQPLEPKQMTSTTIASLLGDLGVTRSLSRPRTSNDNPYSQAAFKTTKYRPDYSDRFATLAQARVWIRRFVAWYNHDHYHSGIAYLHPADVHAGTAGATVGARQDVLDDAYAAHPDRFRHHPPVAAAPPDEAWINKRAIQTTT